jgi:hypothetical protein
MCPLPPSRRAIANDQIFTADEPEVEALPRKEVVAFLEKTNKEACIGYLEHLIDDLQDTSAEFHDQLAELYLEQARTSDGSKQKLLHLLGSSQYYRANRLLGKLKGDGQYLRSSRKRPLLKYQNCLRSRQFYWVEWVNMMRLYGSTYTVSKIILLLRRESVQPTELSSADEIDTVPRSTLRVQNNKTDQFSSSY